MDGREARGPLRPDRAGLGCPLSAGDAELDRPRDPAPLVRFPTRQIAFLPVVPAPFDRLRSGDPGATARRSPWVPACAGTTVKWFHLLGPCSSALEIARRPASHALS